jgi:hypothetical protein
MRRLHATLISSMLFPLAASCERPPELVGIVNADVPIEAVPDVTQHRVLITTTREASDALGRGERPDTARPVGERRGAEIMAEP